MVFENIEETINKLYRYCIKLSRSTWLAEDLVQETMVKVYKLKKLEPDRLFSTSFLFQVAKNLFIDEKRKSREFYLFDEETNSGSQDFIEYDSLIEILVTTLPLKQAMLLTLKDVFGYSSKEIASMLRISNESIKTALHRARKKLESPAVKPSTNRDVSNHKIISGLSKALKDSNPVQLFYYYRLLETRNYQFRSRPEQSVCYVIDPDGNILELSF
ncbi:RNA polymerase sigma-70 factor (ECF subfamily) [Bacillus pakistanensis]|uniref:RNA polymerase sigma factor n=1 Tax=Rossellomorea pakistanensis TaxID=992288 RepID=A0ABS2NI62_9BACI|nr:RNA polymerase sigma factor [Bacillus pakistanensis]MBM7587464.1 RNA polymerase sigma-70 factor (ECF subfamily) [Bacillus pakistanensis]